jgi:hemerythrin-like metal-binding protein
MKSFGDMGMDLEDSGIVLIEWKDKYSVGHPVLDLQHQGLVQLINQLTKEVATGGMITYVFDELDHYVKEHFRFEEKLLRQADFQQYQAHKAQHRVFEQWLRAVRQSFSIGGMSALLLAESVNAYLRSWLINHILKSDMEYKAILSSD